MPRLGEFSETFLFGGSRVGLPCCWTMNVFEEIDYPQQVEVWPEGKVALSDDRDEGFPRMTYFLPAVDYRSGHSVLLLPGGGYGGLSSQKEGYRPAMFLASHGIAAGVLEYRHSPRRFPVPLLDAQRGMRRLRFLAREHELDENRVGTMGFSAGGHLTGLVATQSEHPDGCVGDLLDSVSCAADFAVFVYPVVSFIEKFSHAGSGNNLLGTDRSPEESAKYSIERCVTADTPRSLIVHGQADIPVPPANALALYSALTDHGVDASMHLYEKELHGFGLGLGTNLDWGRVLIDWLGA